MADKEKMMVQKGGTRLKCPKCGCVNQNMIRETDDENHIIYDYPRIYGKKYHCGQCGIWFKWDKDEEE